MRLFGLLGSILVLWLSGFPSDIPPARGSTWVQNGDFEGTFSARMDPYHPEWGIQGELTIADGWEAWWRPHEDGMQVWEYHRPEYKPDSGRASGTQQKQFTTYSTHDAGLYQTVSVPSSHGLAFKTRVYVWSSNLDDWSASVEPGDYEVMVGIDPTGNTDAFAGTVVWSSSQIVYDQWIDLRVSVLSQTETATLFLRGKVKWAVKNNNAYWDDAVLTLLTLQHHLPCVVKG